MIMFNYYHSNHAALLTPMVLFVTNCIELSIYTVYSFTFLITIPSWLSVYMTLLFFSNEGVLENSGVRLSGEMRRHLCQIMNFHL